jgi:hypothetical protein
MSAVNGSGTNRLLLLLLLTNVAGAQVSDPGVAKAQLMEQVKGRAEELRQIGISADLSQNLAEFIRGAIDAYLIATFDVNRTTAEEVRQTLAEVLPNPQSARMSDLGAAWLGDLRGGRSLIVSYRLLRDWNDSYFMLRGYRQVNGLLQFVADAGGDMDGHFPVASILRSPVVGETWVLVWGGRLDQKENYTRFRVIAFDGNAFRTLWSPPDFLNVGLQTTQEGFTLSFMDQDFRRLIRVEDYKFFADGPKLVSTKYSTTPR